MYHRIVASKVRQAFAQISAGNWQAMIDSMATEFTYRFYGEHALSGERHTTAALTMWWERNFRLMKDPRFEVMDIVVSGPPWATKVATLVEINALVAGTTPYSNIFMQMMKMSWGRITDIKTLEDTVVLERALAAASAAGMAEATADPITDQLAAAP